MVRDLFCALVNLVLLVAIVAQPHTKHDVDSPKLEAASFLDQACSGQANLEYDNGGTESLKGCVQKYTDSRIQGSVKPVGSRYTNLQIYGKECYCTSAGWLNFYQACVDRDGDEEVRNISTRLRCQVCHTQGLLDIVGCE